MDEGRGSHRNRKYCCKVPSYIVFFPNKFAAQYMIHALKGAKEKLLVVVPITLPFNNRCIGQYVFMCKADMKII